MSGNKGALIERLIEDDKQLPLQSRSILLHTYKTKEAPKKTKKKAKKKKVNYKFSVKQLVVVIGAPNPVPMKITSVNPLGVTAKDKDYGNMDFKFNEIEPYNK